MFALAYTFSDFDALALTLDPLQLIATLLFRDKSNDEASDLDTPPEKGRGQTVRDVIK